MIKGILTALAAMFVLSACAPAQSNVPPPGMLYSHHFDNRC